MQKQRLGSTGKMSELKVITRPDELEMLADITRSTLRGRASCTLQMRQIRAAVDKTEFLTKTQSLVDADGADSKAMLFAFTDREREQVISLLTQVYAAKRHELD